MSFDIKAYFEDRRTRVDQALAAGLAIGADPRRVPADGSDPGRLVEAMRYAVLQGGKRMRPLLTIAACEAAGGTTAAAVPAACALELIHAYSLVHDDLPAMDNDLERRGQPTVHVAFGEANAILVGDALLTRAFGLLAEGARVAPQGRLLDAVWYLAHHAGVDGMVGGQAMDLAAGQDIGNLEMLEAVHAKKTGALYAAAGAMGALSAGADDELVSRLERFGLEFGVAFQHADDVLDDDQQALREAAMVRVKTLVASCEELVAGMGERAEPLRQIARWVGARAERAYRGDRSD